MSKLPPELKGRKASEVFLEYAMPYLELIAEFKSIPLDDMSIEEIKKALALPWKIWNISVMGGGSKKLPMNVDDFINANNEPEGCVLFNFLRERKDTLYKKYDYLLGKYKIYFNKEENDLKLSVTSHSKFL